MRASESDTWLAKMMIHMRIKEFIETKLWIGVVIFFSSSLIYQVVNTFYIKCLLTCFYVELIMNVPVYKVYLSIYCCITQFYRSAL